MVGYTRLELGNSSNMFGKSLIKFYNIVTNCKTLFNKRKDRFISKFVVEVEMKFIFYEYLCLYCDIEKRCNTSFQLKSERFNSLVEIAKSVPLFVRSTTYTTGNIALHTTQMYHLCHIDRLVVLSSHCDSNI